MRSYRRPVDNQSTYRESFVRGFGDTYEIAQYAPQAVVSTVPAGQWSRGELLRSSQPAFVGPSAIGYYNFDPTSPNGWVNNQS